MMVWTLGTATVAPFYVVFMTRDLGLDARGIGLLTAVSTGAQLVGFLLLGPRVDRRGNRGTLIGSVLVLALVPFGWLLVREWMQILPLYVLAGLASAGMTLASLNMLLELSPEENRAGYAGAYYSVLAAAAMIAPLIGGWLFARWGFAGAALVGGLAVWPAWRSWRSCWGAAAQNPRRSVLERRGSPSLGVRFRTT